MKTFIILVLAISVNLFGQKTPEHFLGKIPTAKNICEATYEQKRSFLDEINNLAESISSETNRRSEELSENVDKDKVLKEQLEKSNIHISENEMQDVENMSDAEREALAQKIAQQAMKGNSTKNISMDQVNKMKNDNDFLLKMQDPNGDGFAGKINKIAKEIDALVKSFEENSAKEIDPLKKELAKINDGEGMTPADAAKGKALNRKIYTIEMNLCTKYSGQHQDLLNKYLYVVKNELPNIRKAESMSLAGLNKKSNDVSALNAVKGYLGMLKNVYQFNPKVGSPE